MADPSSMDVDASTSSLPAEIISTSAIVSEMAEPSTLNNGAIAETTTAVAMDVDSPWTKDVVAGPSITSSVPPNGQASPIDPSITPGEHRTLITVRNDGNSKRIVRTGYVYDPLMMLHCQDGYIPTADDVIDTGDGHPEEPMRIKRIFTRLKENGLIRRMQQLISDEATFDQVSLVHDENHWFKVQGTESESRMGETDS